MGAVVVRFGDVQPGALLLHRARSHGCPLPQGWQIQLLTLTLILALGSLGARARTATLPVSKAPVILVFQREDGPAQAGAKMLLLAGFVTLSLPRCGICHNPALERLQG